MNRSGVLLGCLLLCGFGAWAQQEAPKIVVNIEGFRYPPIARSARVQGGVIFEVSASGLRLVAGNSILSKAAEANLVTWTLPPLEAGKYLVSYYFEILGEEVTRKTVPIGSKFGRLLRRLVGAPTEEVVNTCYPPNYPTVDPLPRYTVVKDGDVTIDVVIGTFPPCAMIEASQVAGNSHL
jgi:hypothetical protein